MVPADGSYIIGNTLNFTVIFSKNMTITGTDSTLGLTIGTAAKTATYLSKTGYSITYQYKVLAGDLDTDGIAVTALTLNTSTMKDAAGNNAILTLSGVPSTMSVKVDGVVPKVLSVTVPANMTYSVGKDLNFTVTFSENVIITGTDSTLSLNIGGVTRNASYLSKTANSISYRYTVQAGDQDTDGIGVVAIVPNTTIVTDVAGNNAFLTLTGVASTLSVLVDGIVPKISSVTVPVNGTYIVGSLLNFTVTFSEPITVTGTDSTLTLNIGGVNQNAAYLSKGTNSITYQYKVQGGDKDTDGIGVIAIIPNSTVITDVTGNNAVLTLNGVPSTSFILVDGVVSTVASVSVPNNSIYILGSILNFTVNFNENVIITGTNTTLTLDIGGVTRNAAYISQTANSITYRYTVVATDLDMYGVTVVGIKLNTTTIRNVAGNNADLTLNGVGDTKLVLVDTIAPKVSTVTVPANGSYILGSNLDFTVNFSENVTVTGTDSTLGLTIGTVAKTATYLSKTENSITYRYTVQAGDTDTDGIAVTTLTLNTSTIKDAGGNNATLTLSGLPSLLLVKVDGVVPKVSSVTVPANKTYIIGNDLNFTVNFSEPITVTGTDSTLKLDIGGVTRNANYQSTTASGINYRYTIQAGDKDIDGIGVVGIVPNTTMITDVAGNNAVQTLNGVPSTALVLVDGIVPTVTSVTVPANGTYNLGSLMNFTVTFSENMTVTGTDTVLTLDIGGITRNATYLSKAANSITYQYKVQAGDLDADGVSIVGIALNTTSIRDGAGNDAILTLTKVDLASVLVDGVTPVITSLTVTNGVYCLGNDLNFTITFNKNVIISGTDSTLALKIGTVTKTASYLSKTDNSISYLYTVQAGDLDTDGIVITGLTFNTTVIQDVAGNYATISLSEVGNKPLVTVDGVVPGITSVNVPTNGTYHAGDTMNFTTNYSENITVIGTDSSLILDIGGVSRSANYLSKTDTSITYQYIVQSGDQDLNGIGVTGLAINNTTIIDLAGNNATVTLKGIGSTLLVLVNGVEPTVSSVIVPANMTYNMGNVMNFTINFSENITVTGIDSTLALNIGGITRNASYLSKTVTSITYQYTVLPGDQDLDGIDIAGIILNMTTIRNAAGNNANLTLNGVPSTFLVKINGTSNIQVASITAGKDHSVIMKNDNSVWAWGVNQFGQLGNGTLINMNVPSQINWLGVDKLAITIASGGSNSLLVNKDGSVWAWGNNNYGQLGDGTAILKTTPIQVLGPDGHETLSNIIKIAVGNEHALALSSDGIIWTWGRNDSGQLGDSTFNSKNIPVRVHLPGDITGYKSIVTGNNHSFVIANDGSLWAWGDNSLGQLGDGSKKNQSTPIEIDVPAGSGSFWAVAAKGNQTIALKTDGTVWAWGCNSFGQLGNNTKIDQVTPVQVKGLGGTGFLTDIVAISCGDGFAMAVKLDGTVWAWGSNAFGQLGDGTKTDRLTPVQVKDPNGVGVLSNIIAIALGDNHVIALKADHTVYVWGKNTNGQLGDGTNTDKLYPELVDFVSPTIPVVQDPVVDTSQHQITISWSAATDPTPGAGIKGYQIQYQINGGVWQRESSLITGTTWIKTNLTMKDRIKFQVRAVDNNGNYSIWSVSTAEVCLKSLSPTKVTSLTGEAELVNLKPNYKVTIVVPATDAAGYKYYRKNNEGIVTCLTPDGTQSAIFVDKADLMSHGKYEYGYKTYNAFGIETTNDIKWADGQTSVIPGILAPKVLIPNISPGLEVSGPAPIVVSLNLSFTLGSVKDLENDNLEYRLYTRIPGTTDRNLAESWNPSIDNQIVSKTFPDKTTLEWAIFCIESDGSILDSNEVQVTAWNRLAIDTQYPLPHITNVFGEDSRGTKGQELSCHVESNSTAHFVSFEWDFGDDSPKVTVGADEHTTHKYSDLGHYYVTVTATDSNGAKYTGETTVDIENTTHGQLYDKETWSGSHIITGNITIPEEIVLTVQSGTQVLIDSGCEIRNYGSLQIVGTGITFDVHNGGLWKGIRFDGSGFGTIDGAIIYHAERGVACTGSGLIYLQNTRFIENSTGVHCFSGIITVDSCTFQNNTIYGIKEDNDCNPLVTYCIFITNGINYYDSILYGISLNKLNILPNGNNKYR
jgi:alpha-tubulin suppressor-like RCC1 family protein